MANEEPSTIRKESHRQYLEETPDFMQINPCYSIHLSNNSSNNKADRSFHLHTS